MFKRIRARLFWLQKKYGKDTVDLEKGVGYYITLGLWNHNPKDRNYEFKLESGRTGIYKLISYKHFRDPNDMIKEAQFMLLSYKGETPIKECSFKEFWDQYVEGNPAIN